MLSYQIFSSRKITVYSDNVKVWVRLRDLLQLLGLNYNTGRFVNYYNKSFSFVRLKGIAENIDHLPLRRFHVSRNTFFVSFDEAELIVHRFSPDLVFK